jgi:hypothetical protein
MIAKIFCRQWSSRNPGEIDYPHARKRQEIGLVLIKRSTLPSGVTAWWLNLDDVGTEICQDFAAHPAVLVREIQHTIPCQCLLVHALLTCPCHCLRHPSYMVRVAHSASGIRLCRQ